MIYNMQLQLTRLEAAEYARLRTRFFGNNGTLSITPETEADPDFQRYVIINKKMQVMFRFWRKLNDASPSVYIRVQRWVERACNGAWIRGFSPGTGLILDPHYRFEEDKN